MPRRTAVGVDHNRISLLIAVLAKRIGLELGDQDIFLNKPVDPQMVIFGEVGLAGEVRGVIQPEARIREAEKMGFTRCILSNSNLESCSPYNIRMYGVNSVSDLMDILF